MRKSALPLLLFAPVVAAGSLSCGELDTDARTLRVGAFTGKIVDTAGDPVDVASKGARVVYRFRSVPGLVYVRRVDETMELKSIEQSGRIGAIIASAAKRPRPSREPGTSGLRASSPGTFGEPVPTYLESGFDLVGPLLRERGLGLAPVRVAIIDSGVISSTGAIEDALVEVTNYTRSPSPDEWQNHATAIASVYAGLDWQGQTVNSYAPNALLHSIKISFSGDKEDDLAGELGALQLAVALDEAVARGARVVNMSFSYRGKLPEQVRLAEQAVIANALSKGVVFVAAAGNAGESIDTHPLFPARYDLENIVVVGNHSALLRRAYSSNYGQGVDVTAQGMNLPLSNKNGAFDYFSGTSFSVPVVGAALATYFGLDPKAGVSKALDDLYASSANAYLSDRDGGSSALAERLPVSRYGRLRADALLQLLLDRPGLALTAKRKGDAKGDSIPWRLPR